jgi:hypothetical protein
MKTMKELVDEYNELTGKNVKRFATTSHAEKAIAKLSAPVEEKKSVAKKEYKMRIEVDGVKHRSVASAFHDIGLPMGKCIRFRGVLRSLGVQSFDHDGKKYHFKILK